MFFSLFRQRFRAPDRGGYNAGYLKCLYLLVFKRDHVARFRLDKMSSLRSVLRDSLRSNKSSHRLRRRTQSSHFIANLLAIATLGPFNSPKGEGPFVLRPLTIALSLLSAISSRKATGRRTQFGNLGIVQASLTLLSLLLSFRPPSRNLIRVIRNEGITGTGLFTGYMALKGTKGYRKAL